VPGRTGSRAAQDLGTPQETLIRSMRLRRLTWLAWLFALSAGADAVPPAPPPAAPAVLAPGVAVERAITGGEKQYFSFPLDAGNAVELRAEQLGADIGLTLRDPDGTTVFEGNSPNGAHGDEPLMAVAAVGGTYELEVWSLIPRAPEGRFALLLSAPRPATEADRQRFATRARAWKLQDQGFELLGGARSEAAVRDAIAMLEQAVPLWAQLGEIEQQARGVNAIGLSYRQLGEPDRAERLYLQALALWRQAGNRGGEADQLNNLGRLATVRGDLRAALVTHRQALAIRRAIDDRRGVAESLGQLGATLRQLGEPDEAYAALEEALAISNELDDRGAESHTRNNLGLVDLDRGRPQQAIEQFRAALALFEQAGSLRYQAVTLSNLGSVYQSIGDYPRARDLLGKALALNREMGDRHGEAITRFNLGWASLRDDDPTAALAEFEAALGEFEAVKDRRGQGRALVGKGVAELESDRYEAAEPSLRAGLAVLSETGDLQGQFDARQSLGTVLAKRGQPDAALYEIATALELAQRMENSGAQAQALTEGARIELGLGQLTASQRRVEQAIALTESIRGRVASQTHRTTYLARSLDRYELLTDILMARERLEPGHGYAAAALANAERARARSLLEQLGEVGLATDADPALAAEIQVLGHKINARERRRLELAAGAEQSATAEVAALETEIREMLDRWVDLRARLRTENPRYKALAEPAPATVAQLQDELLDDGTLLLELALGERASYLWVLSRSRLDAYRLPPRTEIEPLAQQVAQLLQAPARLGALDPAQRSAALARSRADLADASQRLSDLLFGEVGVPEGSLRLEDFKSLVVASDGALRSLPFAVLPPPRSGAERSPAAGTSAGAGAYLVQSHEIVHTPSASVLLLQRRELADRTPARHQLAVFADPVFRRDDPRVGGQLAAADPGDRLRSDDAPANDASGSDAPGGGFARLRFSRREAERLAELVPAEQRWVALSFDASRAAVSSPRLEDYRIVHFATHGVLNSEQPELSGVVLSLVDRDGSPQEGFLRLHDIYGLRLGADLVVLSACSTALGQQVPGEGLVGLVHGFMYAGAPRVVASLWQVPDRASAELMERFYRAMLTDGASAAAALRQAQMAMLTEGRFADPFDWGAFVLQGDWR
jgi:CHAT domain-containing protein/Tfp pilus assembly protein PilF